MASAGFLHLNDDAARPGFELHGLVAEPGDGTLRLATQADGTYAPRGVWRGGPFSAAEAADWYRLQVEAEPLPERTHVQVYTFAADAPDAPFDPAAAHPFGAPGWTAAPLDALDLLLPGPPAPRLWVGGVVRGDGASTPLLRQMRVDYGRDTLLRHLPALYAADADARDFLERFLSLQDSVLGGLEREIADLARRLDAEAAPDGSPSWLGWLAGWLAFAPNEAWSEAETRANVGEAYRLYGRRGTVAGLRRYVEMYSGLEAHVDEPLQAARVWSLGETSALGFDTMLAPEPPEGAVLGHSAVLDRSHVRETDAVPVLADLAHRFCVLVRCTAGARPGALEDARAVLEREKPAHTEAHLCVVEPRLRVGLQARVGIDAVVGGGRPFALGDRLGEAAMAGSARACSREGEQ
jgi:phage tail-like protein